MKTLSFISAFSLTLAVQSDAQTKSRATENGFIGPVHTIRLEIAIFKCQRNECSEGKRRRSTIEWYDARGRLISGNTTLFDPDSPAHRLRRYPFGDNSPIIERPAFAPDGSFAGREVFVFDNHSMQSEHIRYLADGSMEDRTAYLFNHDGRLGESVTYGSNHELVSRIVYAYDDDGNKTEEATYAADGSLKEIALSEYEFDDVGNWIKRKMSVKRREDGRFHTEPIAVLYRTITYH